MRMLWYTENVQKFMQELQSVRLKYALLNNYSIMLPFCVSQLGAKNENHKKELWISITGKIIYELSYNFSCVLILATLIL